MELMTQNGKLPSETHACIGMGEAQSSSHIQLSKELSETQNSIVKNFPDGLTDNYAEDPKYEYVYSLMFDLIFHCFDDSLSVNIFWKILAPILSSESKTRILGRMLLDLISMFDQVVNSGYENQANSKKILHRIIAFGLDQGVLDKNELRAKIDILSSEQIGLLANANMQSNLLVKLKTKLYFKSIKYNLLREESEGYSKLLLELLDTSYSVSFPVDENVTSNNVNNIRKFENDEFDRYKTFINNIIITTIGYYNLDPNRILGFLIECYEGYDGLMQHKKFLLNIIIYFILIHCRRNNVISLLAMQLQTIDSKVTTVYDIVELLNDKLKNSSLRALLKEIGVWYFVVEEHVSSPKTQLNNEVEMNEESDNEIESSKSSQLENHLYCDFMGELYDYIPPSDSTILSMYEEQQTVVYDLNLKMSKINFFDETPTKNRVSMSDVCRKSILPYIKKFDLGVIFIENHDWENLKKFMCIFPPAILGTSEKICASIFKVISGWIDPLYKRIIDRRLISMTPASRSTAASIDEGDSEQSSIMLSSIDFAALKQPIFYELMNIVSFNFRKNVRLMVKLLRVSAEMIRKESDLSSGVHSMVHMCICQVFLPALSYSTPNPFLVSEIWDLIKLFPYQTRFRIYGYWKNVSYDKSPSMECVKSLTLKINKYIMKRITKDNIRMCGRQIGKLCHNNPMLVFDDILQQLQKYNNFIQPLCESLKYLTDMEFDVLMCCLLEALVKTSSTLKNSRNTFNSSVDSETSISEEKHNLALFSGVVMRKYQVELSIMLQYISNQLKDGNSLDLIILKELLSKVSGYDMIEDMNASQLDAIAGSELLKDEYGVGANYKSNKKSAIRLKNALVTNNLAVPLYILIAQQQSIIIFGGKTSELHLKMLGNLYDQCHHTLIQYGRFLSAYLNVKDYGEIPSINSLINDYKLSHDTIFYFIRSGFFKAVKIDFIKHAELNFEDFDSIYQLQIRQYEEMCDESVLSSEIQQYISKKLFCVFWLLDLYDICFPCSKYDEAISKTNQKLANSSNDRKDSNLPKKEKDKLKNQILLLTNDKNSHSSHYQHLVSWFEKHGQNFFPKKGGISDANTYFYQLCIYPRCVFSISDALFTAHFIILLHQTKTLHFSTIHILDKIFTNIFPVLISFTEVETALFGRFLNTLLEVVMNWHSDIKIYEQQCYNHPCFMVFGKNQPKSGQLDSGISNFDEKRLESSPIQQHQQPWNCSMDYEQYRLVVFKWHSRMTKVFIGCIRSGEYYQIRNTILLLTKIVDHYPRIGSFAELLEKNVLMLCQREKDQRPDLYALALSYTGILRGRKNEFVADNLFCKIEFKKRSNSSAGNAKTADVASNINPSESSHSAAVIESSAVSLQVASPIGVGSTRQKVRPVVSSSNNNSGSDFHTLASSKEKRRFETTAVDFLLNNRTTSVSVAESNANSNNLSTTFEAKRSKLNSCQSDGVALKKTSPNPNQHSTPSLTAMNNTTGSGGGRTSKDNPTSFYTVFPTDKRTRSWAKTNSSGTSTSSYSSTDAAHTKNKEPAGATNISNSNASTINNSSSDYMTSKYSSISKSDLVAARHSARLARRNQQQQQQQSNSSSNSTFSGPNSISKRSNYGNVERDVYKSRTNNDHLRDQRR